MFEQFTKFKPDVSCNMNNEPINNILTDMSIAELKANKVDNKDLYEQLSSVFNRSHYVMTSDTFEANVESIFNGREIDALACMKLNYYNFELCQESKFTVAIKSMSNHIVKNERLRLNILFRKEYFKFIMYGITQSSQKVTKYNCKFNPDSPIYYLTIIRSMCNAFPEIDTFLKLNPFIYEHYSNIYDDVYKHTKSNVLDAHDTYIFLIYTIMTLCIKSLLYIDQSLDENYFYEHLIMMCSMPSLYNRMNYIMTCDINMLSHSYQIAINYLLYFMFIMKRLTSEDKSLLNCFARIGVSITNSLIYLVLTYLDTHPDIIRPFFIECSAIYSTTDIEPLFKFHDDDIITYYPRIAKVMVATEVEGYIIL